MSPARSPEEDRTDRTEAPEGNTVRDVSRRTFLRLGALVGAGASVAGLGGVSGVPAASAGEPGWSGAPSNHLEEATIARLLADMEAGRLTAVQLVDFYLDRIESIDQRGPTLNSVIEVNPQAEAIARVRDRERRQGQERGPLHGIPILLKDNIDTADRMMTTAGSLALVGAPALRDATVTRKLRQAGAVILGKANLSEWANFRGFGSSSGWSGRGGQTRNPYVLDRNPCGSSSGSAVAVAANLTAAALATETDGSIVCPAHQNGIVGLKPTVGLTSRAGVIPISHTQDTVGPHARTVADAAAVLGSLTGVDPRDPATRKSAGKFHTDYTPFVDPDGLQGARIGVVRGGGFTGYSEETDAIFEAALEAMEEAGATLVETEIPNHDELNADPAEIIVLIYEFKRDLNAYLATRTGVPIHSLADAIEFNIEHADRELKWFGQELFILAEQEIFTEQEYLEALERGPRLAGTEGIDAALAAHDLDALVAPTGAPAWPIDLVNGDHFLGASSSPAAIAGYPLITVNAGFAHGVLPVGISFMGTAFGEPTLIKVASGFEHVIDARRAPRFLKTMPLDGPSGAHRSRLAAARAARLERMISGLTKAQAVPLRRIFGL